MAGILVLFGLALSFLALQWYMEKAADREEPRNSMKKEYEFRGANCEEDAPHLVMLQSDAAIGKTRVTILLDDDVLDAFHKQAEAEGRSFQTEINEALREAVKQEVK